MSRVSAFLVVLAVWAVVYLPALGSIAIKGEEGRRILPAIRMLETGNYIVPQVGSNPYFRKPPLVNWLGPRRSRFLGCIPNGQPACPRRLPCSRWASPLSRSRAPVLAQADLRSLRS